MSTKLSSLQAIVYSKGQLQLLDQRLLPLQSEYLDINTIEDAFHAIRDMVVRGAPAIGVTAALATAVELHNLSKAAFFKDLPQIQQWIDTKMTFLAERYNASAGDARHPRTHSPAVPLPST